MDVAVELSRHNQLDAYWLSEAQLRCLEEKFIRSWETDLAEVTPEILDERLAGVASTIHRVSWVDVGRTEVVLEMRGCLVGLEAWANHMWVGIAAPDVASGRDVLEHLVALFPEPDGSGTGSELALSIWSSDGHRGGMAVGRELEVRPWEYIADNYAAPTRDALEPLMDGFTPSDTGRLILFHGAPGTGKSTALAAMGFAWRAWARLHYVADPEELLSHPPYLFDLGAARTPAQPLARRRLGGQRRALRPGREAARRSGPLAPVERDRRDARPREPGAVRDLHERAPRAPARGRRPPRSLRRRGRVPAAAARAGPRVAGRQGRRRRGPRTDRSCPARRAVRSPERLGTRGEAVPGGLRRRRVRTRVANVDKKHR